jgi:hypothetical protein
VTQACRPGVACVTMGEGSLFELAGRGCDKTEGVFELVGREGAAAGELAMRTRERLEALAGAGAADNLDCDQVSGGIDGDDFDGEALPADTWVRDVTQITLFQVDLGALGFLAEPTGIEGDGQAMLAAALGMTAGIGACAGFLGGVDGVRALGVAFALDLKNTREDFEDGAGVIDDGDGANQPLCETWFFREGRKVLDEAGGPGGDFGAQKDLRG